MTVAVVSDKIKWTTYVLVLLRVNPAEIQRSVIYLFLCLHRCRSFHDNKLSHIFSLQTANVVGVNHQGMTTLHTHSQS